MTGGYLERFPLAAVASGIVDHAEIWSFANGDGESGRDTGRPDGTIDPGNPAPTRRVFRTGGSAPYGSAEAVDFIRAVGAPNILCVWSLGVDRALLDACAPSLKIYNSIDAPALRIPDDLAARFDLFLTGAEWQSREIEARRPGTRGLLVVGYGNQVNEFRDRAAREGLDLEIVGPPGVSHDEVNRQINRARVGVVCGVDDGAPAILTEYQLAGLPVLADARLSCGLQFVTPDTGMTAHEGADFAEAPDTLLRDYARYDTRPVALSRWGWQPSMAALAEKLTEIRNARMVQ